MLEKTTIEEIRKWRRRIFWGFVVIAIVLGIIGVKVANRDVFSQSSQAFPFDSLLFILSISLFGLALRAGFLGKDSENKTVEKLLIGYIVYLVVVVATSFLILSTFTYLGDGWKFYATALPIGFFVGILGLGILDTIKIQ